jgi:hypothetical protein
VKLQRQLQLRDNIFITTAVGDVADGTDVSDYTLVATFNGQEFARGALDTFQPTRIGGKYYYVLPNVQATSVQMCVPVVITVSYQGTEIQTLETSIKEYAEYKYNDPNESISLKKLVAALVDFGAYSQMFFNIDPTNLPNENIGVGEGVISGAVIGDEYAAVGDRMQRLDLATAFASTIALDSGDKATKEALKDFEFYLAGAKVDPSEIGGTGNYYYATQRGLRSIDLGVKYSYKLHQLSTNVDVAETTCCALSWAYDYQNNAERGMLCKALYLYYIAADAYFGTV